MSNMSWALKGRADGRKMLLSSGEATIDYQTSSFSISKAFSPRLTKLQGCTYEHDMGARCNQQNGQIVLRPIPSLMIPTFKEVCEATFSCSTSGSRIQSMESLLHCRLPITEDCLPVSCRHTSGCDRHLHAAAVCCYQEPAAISPKSLPSVWASTQCMQEVRPKSALNGAITVDAISQKLRDRLAAV